MIKFTDGVAFKTDGPLRIESRYDGLYVVGQGMLIPVMDREEGMKLMFKLTRRCNNCGAEFGTHEWTDHCE